MQTNYIVFHPLQEKILVLKPSFLYTIWGHQSLISVLYNIIFIPQNWPPVNFTILGRLVEML